MRRTARLAMPRAAAVTPAAAMRGVANSSDRCAQPAVMDGAPSHLKKGSSNPYGPLPWATANAKSTKAHRQVAEVIESVDLDKGRDFGARLTAARSPRPAVADRAP